MIVNVESKDIDVGETLIANKENLKLIGISQTSSIIMPGLKNVIPDHYYSFITP